MLLSYTRLESLALRHVDLAFFVDLSKVIRSRSTTLRNLSLSTAILDEPWRRSTWSALNSAKNLQALFRMDVRHVEQLEWSHRHWPYGDPAPEAILRLRSLSLEHFIILKGAFGVVFDTQYLRHLNLTNCRLKRGVWEDLCYTRLETLIGIQYDQLDGHFLEFLLTQKQLKQLSFLKPGCDCHPFLDFLFRTGPHFPAVDRFFSTLQTCNTLEPLCIPMHMYNLTEESLISIAHLNGLRSLEFAFDYGNEVR